MRDILVTNIEWEDGERLTREWIIMNMVWDTEDHEEDIRTFLYLNFGILPTCFDWEEF